MNLNTMLLLKIRDELIRVNGIVFAYVHGGFIESKYFRDIDIAIWIKNWNEAFNYTINLPVTLELKFNYPIDIQILNEAPLPFKYHVFTNGKLLFSKNEKLRSRIINEVIRMYMDFNFKYKLIEYT